MKDDELPPGVPTCVSFWDRNKNFQKFSEPNTTSLGPQVEVKLTKDVPAGAGSDPPALAKLPSGNE